MNQRISRRQFTRCLGHGTLALGAISGFGTTGFQVFADASGDSATEALTQYAYLIMPLLGPEHAVYRAVADKVTGQASQAPEIASLMESGMAALEAAGRGGWLQLPMQDKVQVIGNLSATPFFGYLRWITSEVVMRDPSLWQSVGYQGSAIEHGGYLYRGFDDIDWLPPSGPGN